jgi:formate hydrogenlyase subunit 6/NADH:ubiquinone oxidoreductase subunit I
VGILKIILQNLEHKPRTRRIKDPVPYPEGYRGMVQYEAPKCIGCKTCAYVCASGAISFDEEGERPLHWRYFAEQCTFCGRCVDYCPTGALGFARSAPVVTGDRTLHRVSERLPYQSCPGCGRQVLPLPDDMLSRQYGDPLPEPVLRLNRLCPRCRRKVTTERVKYSTTWKKESP